ncbi:hypothetical protein JB92DRAFT_2888405 [Gautieria morchelliformis]|nr:hypothetical protein JB92DRAFT_2888405 [Gautieria morchelliformis]
MGFKYGISAFVNAIGPTRLLRSSSSNSLPFRSQILSAGSPREPAALIRRSMRPSVSSTMSLTTLWTDLEEATSNLMARTLWPSFADALTTGFKAGALSAVRDSAITNVFGWPANCFTNSSPTPLLAPVITTTRFPFAAPFLTILGTASTLAAAALAFAPGCPRARVCTSLAVRWSPSRAAVKKAADLRLLTLGCSGLSFVAAGAGLGLASFSGAAPSFPFSFGTSSLGASCAAGAVGSSSAGFAGCCSCDGRGGVGSLSLCASLACERRMVEKRRMVERPISRGSRRVGLPSFSGFPSFSGLGSAAAAAGASESFGASAGGASFTSGDAVGACSDAALSTASLGASAGLPLGSVSGGGADSVGVESTGAAGAGASMESLPDSLGGEDDEEFEEGRMMVEIRLMAADMVWNGKSEGWRR